MPPGLVAQGGTRLSQSSDPFMDRLNCLLQDICKANAITIGPTAETPAADYLDPFDDAEPPPLESVRVVIAAGTHQEMEDLGAYVVRKGSPGDGRWDQEAAAMARDAAIVCLNQIPVPYDFTYDCIPGHSPDGESLDVYLVRGSSESLQRFSGSLPALGGSLGEMTPEHTLYAAERLAALLDDGVSAAAAAFGPKETIPEPARRRSPSVHRKRLRAKHGVREGQLLARGHSPASAKRIAARVAELLRGGEGVIEAIERAAQEDVNLEGHDTTFMVPRLVAGITVPRLVEDGWYWKHAVTICKVMDVFLNAGAPLEYAHEVACDTFEATVLKRDRSVGEVQAELGQKLVALLKARFFGDLLGSNTERNSGADWVSGIAAELCLEIDPRTGRKFLQKVALEQTFQEWSNMPRRCRLLNRVSFYKGYGRTSQDALELANRDEDWVFPRPVEKPTLSPGAAGLLGMLLSMAKVGAEVDLDALARGQAHARQ